MYAQIRSELKAFKQIPAKEYDLKIKSIQKLQDLSNQWLAKHKKGDDKKRAELLKLKSQLSTLEQKNAQERNTDPDEARGQLDKLKKRLGKALQISTDAYFDRKKMFDKILQRLGTWLTRYNGVDNEEIKKMVTEAKDFQTDVEKEAKSNEDKIGKGSVVNMDPGDDTIDDAARDLSRARKKGLDSGLRKKGKRSDREKNQDESNHGESKTINEKVDFSKAGKDAPIVLLAHGTPRYPNLLNREVDSAKTYASHFGDKSPKQIVKYLIKNKLPKKYSGVVYIDGCYTAAGNTPQNFAMKVYKLLVKNGYEYLQVKGNLGVAATLNDGTEVVTHAAVEKAYERLKTKKAELEKERNDLSADYIKRSNDIINNELRPFLGKKASAEKKLKNLQNEVATEERTQEIIDGEIRKQTKVVKKIKKELDALNKKAEDIQQEQYADVEINKIKEEIKLLDKDMDFMKMPALTGTFGPEKLAK